MTIEKPNFHVFTGGPGSGKTTLIDALRRKGFACVDEVGRKILQEQAKTGGNATHDGDKVKYRDLMLARSVATFKQAEAEEAPVFFDRGIPELVGYCALIRASAPEELTDAVETYRYNPTVFIAPPWPEIYRQDEERKQDYAEAVRTYEFVSQAYLAADYELIELPKTSVAARVEFVLKEIA